MKELETEREQLEKERFMIRERNKKYVSDIKNGIIFRKAFKPELKFTGCHECKGNLNTYTDIHCPKCKELICSCHSCICDYRIKEKIKSINSQLKQGKKNPPVEPPW